MSIQAVAWALEQDLPGTAKLVLVSLANHADHTNGHCWPSAETIAREASTSLRSVYRYLGALRRNGYIRIIRRRITSGAKRGQQRASDYWILFDRPTAPWDWAEGTEPEGPDDPQDLEGGEAEDTEDGDSIAEQTANLAAGSGAPRPPEAPEQTATVAVRQTANSGSRKESCLEPSGVEPSARARPPRGFEPHAVIAAERSIRSEEARQKATPTFVFIGTRAWDAWTTPRPGFRHHKSTLHTQATIEGRLRTGWWFPSLFPPNHGHDPPQPTMTKDDHDQVANL